MTMRTLLIDADTLVYEAARATEVEVEWEPGLWTLHSSLPNALAIVTNRVAQLKEHVGADAVVMALSDYADPWRRKIMPTYKANRKDIRKPLCFQPLRDAIHEQFPTHQLDGCEGDDVLGILMTDPSQYPGEKVCASIDKDLQTIPGVHLKLHTMEMLRVDPEDADIFHMRQTLTGDTTDGYSGCPKVGPKTAEKILDGKRTYAEMWPAVVATYEKAGLTANDALANARVARILRAQDYDLTRRTIRLWSPPCNSNSSKKSERRGDGDSTPRSSTV